MIEWRLDVVMAERRMRGQKLSKITGYGQNWISRHRQLRQMPPRLSAVSLEKFCEALDCQPGDLLWYHPESEGGN